MRIIARGSAESNKLMSESLTIRDGNEEDQRQLNTLRGEIGQTANQLDRMVNEISNEWAAQSAFLAKERATLATLGTAPSATTPSPGHASTFGAPADGAAAGCATRSGTGAGAGAAATTGAAGGASAAAAGVPLSR